MKTQETQNHIHTYDRQSKRTSVTNGHSHAIDPKGDITGGAVLDGHTHLIIKTNPFKPKI